MFTQHLGSLCPWKLLFLQWAPGAIWPEETALQRRPASSWAGSLHANFPYPFSMGMNPVPTSSASLLAPFITPLLPPFGISPPLNTSCLVASWPWNCQWLAITYCDMHGKPDLCRCRNVDLSEVRHVQPSFPPQWVCDGAVTQVLPALGPSDKELQREGFRRNQSSPVSVR